MNQVGSDACPRSSKRMSDGDSSTVNVALLRIQSESFANSQELRGESLIHLHKIHVLERKTSFFESFSDCRNWANSHNARVTARHMIRHNSGQRSELVFFQRILTCNHHSSSTIRHTRSIGSSYSPSLLEDRGQFSHLF